jgi:hypothetical protein
MNTAVIPQPGNVYFLVAYLDKDLRIPHISTYLCVGKGDRAWYFQEAMSVQQHGLLNIEDAVGHPDCLCIDEVNLSGMLDWDALVAELSDNKAMQDRGKSFAERGSS